MSAKSVWSCTIMATTTDTTYFVSQFYIGSSKNVDLGRRCAEITVAYWTLAAFLFLPYWATHVNSGKKTLVWFENAILFSKQNILTFKQISGSTERETFPTFFLNFIAVKTICSGKLYPFSTVIVTTVICAPIKSLPISGKSLIYQWWINLKYILLQINF